ncbi:MAG: DUF2793 domain-containing protein [Roseinatronobacter sp.]|nr:DUF2793 domain-containing protein [Roseinatronobacter sp.]
MSEFSARLTLPFLQAAQAQKHVTLNEALERLDMLVQLSVMGFDAITPPIAVEEGQIWALAPAPTGDWAGEGGKLAMRSGTGWLFVTPRQGWLASFGTELRIHDGTGWASAAIGPLQNLQGVGIGASHDANTPLAVAGPGSLFTHTGAGHQVKINKSSVADTASMLFQTDWSGRAEIGTTGNDALSFKVSADGALWHEGLVLDNATGMAAAPNGLSVQGQNVVHLGNMVGIVSQSAGQPNGAVLEQGETAQGSYLRLADGTQLCQVVLNAGNPTALGAGSFANPYRTAPQSWAFPMAFASPPLVIGHASTPSADENDRRMLFCSNTISATTAEGLHAARMSSTAGTADCILSVLAIGRWI